MSTNISKKKRDDLLDKIKQIRAFIAAAPQDENTGNLLSYLYELEKDVNGKKYGLVFEEHREEIDEVLDQSLRRNTQRMSIQGIYLLRKRDLCRRSCLSVFAKVVAK